MEPIKDIHICPYCGKYSDAQTGFPFLFQSHRMRYHAHRSCEAKFTALHGMFARPPFEPKPDEIKVCFESPEPESERVSTDPTPQDRRFSPNPKVDRISQGKFYVSDLVAQPSVAHTSHTLSVECEYCHQKIEIHLFAPTNTPKYVNDEACRIAVLEHLRTEHPVLKKKHL